MSSYLDKHHKKVVTLFSRKDFKPMLEDGDTQPSGDALPETVYFTTADGIRFTVPTNADIIIGRQPRADDPPVTIDLEPYNGHEDGVSRHHALIKRTQYGLALCDLDSINGTYINDKRAAALKRYPLVNGDVVKVGRVELTLSYPAPKPATTG